MGATWDDYNAALEMRDIIRKMVNAEVDKIRPRYEMAEVVSIERGFRYCMVRFPGDTEPIKVSMGSIQPQSAGQLVRVEGLIGDRFIADVIGPTYSVANERIDLLEEQVQNGVNLVVNPSFENDYANWSDFWGPVKQNIETSTAHVYHGAKAVRFDLSNPANGVVHHSDVMPCEPSVPVKITYAVKRSGIGAIDRLEILSNTTSGGAIFFQSGLAVATPIPDYNPGTGYEIKQALFTPPAGHYFFRIVNRAWIEDPGACSIWYDNYKAFSTAERTLGSLGDVDLTDATNGDHLIYNGTNWVADVVPPNYIRINGVDYQRSGSFGSISLGTFSGTSPVNYQNVNLTRPYSPPSGYGFTVHILNTNRVNAVHASSPTANPMVVTIAQFANSSVGSLTLGWELVKI